MAQTSEAGAADLTEAEAAVYDRQLRVWGVEVQKRLNAARVLIAGCTGVAAETAKNIVLAGVGMLVLLDNTRSADAAPGNFLVPADADPASSVAEASAATLAEMNPLVRVEAAAVGASLQDEAFLKGFDVVLLAGPSLAALEQLDARASSAGVRLYGAACRGTTSWLWANLGRHTFTPATSEHSSGAQEPQTAQYVPLTRALAQPWAQLHKRRTPRLFCVLRVCAEWERAHGRLPGAGDLASVTEAAHKVGGQEGVGADFAPAELLAEYVGGEAELPPVSAVLGGILANEMLKAVAGSGEPLNNFFFFCLADGAGSILRAG